ncbi:acyltransferase [Rapidithrix thailandica]|uniref:Acyltransferase n=1 Tax=Rapidithrix thailandica TaxID=413964 RepID=A0AAW9SF66_9BACT
MHYIRSLDGLRAVAILLVIFFHFFFVLEVGWIGVQLFFVLSGFLITSILMKSKSYTFGPYVKRFYWRRSVRIFPLYYLYLLGVALLFLLIRQPDTFPQKAPYLFTYTFNLAPLFIGYDFDAFFTHFWSLAVEEQFYMVWPFVIFFLSQKQLKWVLPGIMIVSPLARYFFCHWIEAQGIYPEEVIGEIVYRFTLSHLDAFAFGALIPVWGLHKKIQKPGKGFLWALGLVLLAGLSNYYFLKQDGVQLGISSLGFPIGGTANYQHVWSYTLLNFFSMMFILLLINPSGWGGKVAKVLENSFLVMIGKISYGMYLYHWVIFVFHKKLLHAYMPNMFLSFLAYFLIVLLVSLMSYHAFEKRLLQLKDYTFAKKKKPEKVLEG